MVDILHRIGVETRSTAEVYEALTTIDGLAGWWTRDTSGSTDVGGVITFRFGPGDLQMKVLEAVPVTQVRWECVGGPEEWIGTTVTFDLTSVDGFTVVVFRHEGWAEPVEFMHHCTTKWAVYLISLKQLLEKGAGTPAPDDLWISEWH